MDPNKGRVPPTGPLFFNLRLLVKILTTSRTPCQPPTLLPLLPSVGNGSNTFLLLMYFGFTFSVFQVTYTWSLTLLQSGYLVGCV
jgi:hypothetical protein